MLASDFMGAVAGVLVAIPAFKDQYYRFQREQQKRQQSSSRFPGVRATIASAWERKRSSYDGIDTAFLGAGGIGLVLSFLLKLADL